MRLYCKHAFVALDILPRVVEATAAILLRLRELKGFLLSYLSLLVALCNRRRLFIKVRRRYTGGKYNGFVLVVV